MPRKRVAPPISDDCLDHHQPHGDLRSKFNSATRRKKVTEQRFRVKTGCLRSKIRTTFPERFTDHSRPEHHLLYGPPGTGKSSLIAAIANHLRFDIYDLELTGVDSNSDLRRLLVGMTNRSILVVEDIDCTIELMQREEQDEDKEKAKSKSKEKDKKKAEDKVTLSGLLNFVDGLWSTSGEERIIIFTTNYKERLDPALLRPGRMDMHIHMGYCTPEAFRILVNNYHAIDYHATYPEIVELIKEVTVTPAEVAEVLMRNDDTDVALDDLVELLNSKKKEANEIKTEDKQVDEKKDTNEIKTKSMQVDEKKDGDGIKTESVQVEEKKDDKEVVLKNDSFTEDRSS